ncbi:MAG: adenosine deaminase [Oscillospiraceae bacterium]|nr:adenosine deaminase [Oscillospiraceae bacterium]
MTENRYPFPKVELHLHLDGSIPPETMFALAEKEQIPLPAATLEEFRTWLKVTSDCSSVNEYLERFELPLQLLQSRENLTLVTESLIDVLAAQGYGLAEIRFAPQLHLRRGLTQRDAVEAVLAGQEAGLKKNPSLKTGILLCAMSIGPETLNMAENLETVRLTKEYLGKGVVGCDLAGAEGIVPLRNFHPVFDLARELAVPFTCHAGDSQGPDTVLDALDFGTKRIGHGHHLYDAPELWPRVRENGVTLEICPTSNIQCKTQPSYALHPAKKLFDAGIRVTISTDNMVLAAVTLEEEYDHCIGEMGFAYSDLIRMNLYAAEASFLPEEEKAGLIGRLQQQYQEETNA